MPLLLPFINRQTIREREQELQYCTIHSSNPLDRRPINPLDFLTVIPPYCLLDPGCPFERDLYSCALGWISTVAVSYFIMSDTDSDVYIDVDVECDGETLVELCLKLRANDDPHVLDNIDAISRLINFVIGCPEAPEAQCIAVFEALKKNTSVNHIDFSRLFEGHNCTERSALAAAKYVESSKTLQTLELGYTRYRYSQ
jgi:hypothetical protein